MKEKIFKGIIVATGIGLSYSKYKALELTLNFDLTYLYPVLISIILLFFGAIIYLNKKVYSLETIILNEKLLALKEKINLPNFKGKSKVDTKTDSKKKKPITGRNITFNKVVEPILWLFSALGFGYILGYYFKTYNSLTLRRALNKESKWEREAFLELVDSVFGFFSLGSNDSSRSIYGGFDYNWVAFFIGFGLIAFLYFLFRKTTIISLIKEKIEPFLK